jgi:hypothetical protein
LRCLVAAANTVPEEAVEGASLLAAVLTEMYLCNVCSYPEILRRNGRGTGGGDGLAALHDRFLLRHAIRPLSREGRGALLSNHTPSSTTAAADAGRAAVPPPAGVAVATPPPVVGFIAAEAARWRVAAEREVAIPPEVREALCAMAVASSFLAACFDRDLPMWCLFLSRNSQTRRRGQVGEALCAMADGSDVAAHDEEAAWAGSATAATLATTAGPPAAVVSDRRLRGAARLLRLVAYTSGRTQAHTIDCLLLRHVLPVMVEPRATPAGCARLLSRCASNCLGTATQSSCGSGRAAGGDGSAAALAEVEVTEQALALCVLPAAADAALREARACRQRALRQLVLRHSAPDPRGCGQHWRHRPAGLLGAGLLAPSGSAEGESFLCVHWVAVPKAMRARRINRGLIRA